MPLAASAPSRQSSVFSLSPSRPHLPASTVFFNSLEFLLFRDAPILVSAVERFDFLPPSIATYLTLAFTLEIHQDGELNLRALGCAPAHDRGDSIWIAVAGGDQEYECGAHHVPGDNGREQDEASGIRSERPSTRIYRPTIQVRYLRSEYVRMPWSLWSHRVGKACISSRIPQKDQEAAGDGLPQLW